MAAPLVRATTLVLTCTDLALQLVTVVEATLAHVELAMTTLHRLTQMTALTQAMGKAQPTPTTAATQGTVKAHPTPMPELVAALAMLGLVMTAPTAAQTMAAAAVIILETKAILVDDRTFGQKAKDAFKPGSQVGTHRY